MELNGNRSFRKPAGAVLLLIVWILFQEANGNDFFSSLDQLDGHLLVAMVSLSSHSWYVCRATSEVST
jgi:hypothetical protein